MRPPHPVRSIALYALSYVAVVAMAGPALSVFTDPQLAAVIWIAGAIAFYVMSWRALIPRGVTDYARGFLVLGMTVALAVVAFLVMAAIFRALGFNAGR